MNKTVVSLTLAVLLAATSAFAEHKLLVTDVPEPGQVETRVDYAYSRATGKNDLDEKITDERSAAALSLGAGIVSGLKLSASLPYTFVQHVEEGGFKERIAGFNDVILGARYALTKSLVKLPFDAAVGIDWKLYSAPNEPGDAGTGNNIYAPYLAVSKNLHTFIPYAKYQPEFVVKQHQGQTIHNLLVGTEVEFSHHYSLDVAVRGIYNSDYKGHRSSTDVEIEVGPYINIVKNLYILPKVAYKFIGDIKDDTGAIIVKNADEYTLALGVYCLF